ncbi:MAG TPA: hypothetical protein VFN11_06805 [Ktedonobacterales bacterium]|nr:hypothetical protein [Ktedonobacterales bacterium]
MPIFRPAPYLAVIAILMPTAAVVIAAAILLNQNQQPPVWVPLVILASIPILTLAWLFMRSVRLSPVGISVGRPFQRWREAAWHEIIRAERHGMYIRIYTNRDVYISFAPRLLMDGRQLHKIVLNHLRPQILDGSLRMEALDQMPVPEADLTGTLRARPRNRWPLSGFSLALAGAGGAALALIVLPEPLAGAICVLGIVVALLGIALALWLLQEVIVTTEGLTIIRPWRRSTDEVMWSDVRVLDHSRHWALLRFRVGRSVRCIGPTLLRAPERELMFAFINRYCLQHGVLSYPHRGLF